MTFFRRDDQESTFALEYPEYRTKLVPDFARAFKTNLIEEDREELGLNWVGETNAIELSGLLADIDGGFGYNDFNLGDLVDNLFIYPYMDQFYFGREYSPVLYIEATPEVVDGLARRTNAESCTHQGHGMYRIWWD